MSSGRGRGIGSGWAKPGNVRPVIREGDADKTNTDALRDFFFGASGSVVNSVTGTQTASHTGAASATRIVVVTASETGAHSGAATVKRLVVVAGSETASHTGAATVKRVATEIGAGTHAHAGAASVKRVATETASATHVHAGSATVTRVPAGGGATHSVTASAASAHVGTATLSLDATAGPIVVGVAERELVIYRQHQKQVLAPARELVFYRERGMSTPQPINVTMGPGERLPYRINFINALASIGYGETISSVSWSVSPAGALTASTPSNSTEYAQAVLRDGVAGTTYMVTCSVTTNNGHVIQQSLRVSVTAV